MSLNSWAAKMPEFFEKSPLSGAENPTIFE
jgi:hypothetical protein